MTVRTHIHIPDDGRGLRDVFVDGQKIEKAFFADEKRGIVDYYVTPYKLDKYRKRLLSRRIRGDVQVVFPQACDNGS